MSPQELTQYVKAEAKSLGFDVCGIARAERVPQEISDALAHWVSEGKNGEMHYMERNYDKRIDPRELVPGCRSIISVALNYYPGELEKEPHIARYAFGKDYHKVVKDKLYLLLLSINKVKRVSGRPFCDSAPLLERFWAQQAGIGWIGRNRQLIIPKAGSFFFLGELLIDAELEYDTPFEKNFCGKCNACINNCPTGALSDNGFDARKCLSYLTIEYRGELPQDIGEKWAVAFMAATDALPPALTTFSQKQTIPPNFLQKKKL